MKRTRNRLNSGGFCEHWRTEITALEYFLPPIFAAVYTHLWHLQLIWKHSSNIGELLLLNICITCPCLRTHLFFLPLKNFIKLYSPLKTTIKYGSTPEEAWKRYPFMENLPDIGLNNPPTEVWLVPSPSTQEPADCKQMHVILCPPRKHFYDNKDKCTSLFQALR